jgi:hypothetical protein
MTDNTDFLAEIKSRMMIATSAYSDSRESELQDLKFAAGSPDNNWQWPDEVRNTRTNQTVNARPCLTINKLPQHIKQITNDQRQNRPAGKVIPVDSDADIEVAEIYDGVVKHIEYISDADVAIDTACENQVTFGEGYIRLLTDYVSDDSFDQEIKIARVWNSFSVYMDPMMQDPCGADAKWCFITEEMTYDEFERTYPKAQLASSIQDLSRGDEQMNFWCNEKNIKIAEYFYEDYEKTTLNLYPGNKSFYSGTPEDIRYQEIYGAPKKTRSVQRRKIKWCKTNGFEILEKGEWAGQYIPIIRVVGNEFIVEGKRYVSGIVRNAKDAQRMYNYWTSQEAEMLALAPKAPFIAIAGQIENFQDDWKTANTNNHSVLLYNATTVATGEAILPPPQRSMPPMAQTGLIQAKMGASEDIKGTTGQYDASLGATSNERSGKAILARERQVDTGTYHYVDNLARAVRYYTRQIVDLIPKIYDTQRIARIIGIDEQIKTVKTDPSQQEPVKEIRDPNTNVLIEKIYNLGVGRYDVCVTTGPSYMTKRQEAMESMSQILQANPHLWAVAGDIFARDMDWPGAQELAKRLKKTIDPKLLEDAEDPMVAAANQKMQEMAAELDQLHQMVQNVSKSLEVQESKRKDEEVQIKAYDAETKRLSALQAGLTEDQVQDIVRGTIDSMMVTGDLGVMDSLPLPSEPQQQPVPDQPPIMLDALQ